MGGLAAHAEPREPHDPRNLHDPREKMQPRLGSVPLYEGESCWTLRTLSSVAGRGPRHRDVGNFEWQTHRGDVGRRATSLGFLLEAHTAQARGSHTQSALMAAKLACLAVRQHRRTQQDYRQASHPPHPRGCHLRRSQDWHLRGHAHASHSGRARQATPLRYEWWIMCTVRLSNIATRIGTGACQDLHYGGVKFDPPM
jgi:hypothetical protein